MGMGGVQRTAKFTKYLHYFGWQPHVLTVNPTVYLAKDEYLLNDVEKAGVIIHRTGAKNENNGHHKVVKFKKDSNRKLLSNISQTFLIPDSKILWKNKAAELGSEIIEKENIDLIYSTAPPYTDFLIAVMLKQKYGIPLVLDYRDSWIDCPNNFYPTPFHKNRHRKLEDGVLHNADAVITINSRIKELILEKYPFVNGEKIKVIPQGFDNEDFQPDNTQNKKTKFRITYSGSFLNYYTPKHFLDALVKIFNNNHELKNKIEAMFIGTFPDEYKKYAEENGVLDSLIFTGYIEHSKVTKYLSESDVLWMMINKTVRSDLHSTGKLYEYFGARKSIIACVPEGVARTSLKDHGAVILTGPDDVNAIADAILKYYEMYLNHTLPIPDEKFITAYDRKTLTGTLSGLFDSVSAIETEKVKT
jgi:glycosyltransferase involved in cell wall biosynthesis